MSNQQTRRTVLVALGAAALGGCVGTEADDNPDGSQPDDRSTLRDIESLEAPIPDIVTADDPAAVAEEYGFDYRDGKLKVEIEFAPEGDRPTEYLSDTVSEYVHVSVAYVDLADLSTVAENDAVWAVRKPATPELSDRQAQVEQLPEPSPLASQLRELFLSENRAQLLNQQELNHRDDSVQVKITLTDGADQPQQYLPEEYSAYGDTVIAYVAIDDLVQLALQSEVRSVAPRLDPQLHD